MERRASDETLILDGILRRDDSDRIGAITRMVETFGVQQDAIHQRILAIMLQVQERLTTTFREVTTFMADALTQLMDELSQAAQAIAQAGAELETLLSAPAPDLQAAVDAARGLKESALALDARLKAAQHGTLVANAGADQQGTVGTAVQLDGSGSHDPNGAPLTFAWQQTGGTAITLSDPTTMMPSFTPTAADTYQFTLTVSDGVDTSAPAMVTVTIT
jgi:PKD domain